jgi:hypothetical protein
MATIAGKGSTEVQTNLSTETYQKIDPQNPCKQAADEGSISNMIEVENRYNCP